MTNQDFHARSRDLGLDAARGVALLSMFVAHFAPVPGPFNVLALSEHLTAFLFVVLIGCGAELGRSSSGRWRSSQVRAVGLIVTGLVLMQLPSNIVVVLVWLGMMTLVASWIRELPTWTIAAIGLSSVPLAPQLMTRARDWLAAEYRDPLSAATSELLFSGSSYRVASFVLPVCAGVLLVRHTRSDRSRWLVAAVCLPTAAVLYGLDQTGGAAMEAYSGSTQEFVFNTSISVMVTCAVWATASHLSLVGAILASCGAMALSIYALQIVAAWGFYRVGGLNDNRWDVLLGAFAGAVVLGAVWSPVRRATGWRGPLEALMDPLVQGRRELRGPMRHGLGPTGPGHGYLPRGATTTEDEASHG